MSITSTATRSDWCGVINYFLIALTIPFLLTLIVMFFLFLPMVSIMSGFMPILADDVLIVQIRDDLLVKGFDIGTILIYYIFTLSGGVVISLFILLGVMSQSMSLGKWVANRIKLPETITVFWNGVPTTETKYGRFFKSKKNK